MQEALRQEFQDALQTGHTGPLMKRVAQSEFVFTVILSATTDWWRLAIDENTVHAFEELSPINYSINKNHFFLSVPVRAGPGLHNEG